MIGRQRVDGFEVSCDGCVHHETIDESNFLAVVERLKGAGWKIFTKQGVFYHYCPSCADKDDQLELPLEKGKK